jgi:hypothetical protein
MNNYTTTPGSHLHFENAVGRILVHPSGLYIAIEYHTGPRQPSELQAFLLQAGNMLSRWGWDKLLTAHLSMPDFTPEEVERIRVYWHANVPQHPGLLYGALLLPHAVFTRLSSSRKVPNPATLVAS